MKRSLAILTSMILGAAMAYAAAPGRYPISAEQVAATVNRTGMQITTSQVTLLSEVVATTAAPQLSVRSIAPWGSQRIMARLECESRDQCLPFFVAIQTGDSAAAAAVILPKTKSPAPVPAAKAYAVKSGSPAILELEGERVHIRIAVVCLENGALGQTVRVSGKDHHMVYVGQVVDNNVVRGRL
jgi:hypothetical protein